MGAASYSAFTRQKEMERAASDIKFNSTEGNAESCILYTKLT